MRKYLEEQRQNLTAFAAFDKLNYLFLQEEKRHSFIWFTTRVNLDGRSVRAIIIFSWWNRH